MIDRYESQRKHANSVCTIKEFDRNVHFAIYVFNNDICQILFDSCHDNGCKIYDRHQLKIKAYTPENISQT